MLLDRFVSTAVCIPRSIHARLYWCHYRTEYTSCHTIVIYQMLGYPLHPWDVSIKQFNLSASVNVTIILFSVTNW